MPVPEELMSTIRDLEAEALGIVAEVHQATVNLSHLLSRICGMREVLDQMTDIELNERVIDGGAEIALGSAAARSAETEQRRQPVQKMTLEMLQRAGGTPMSVENVIWAAKTLHGVDLQPKSVSAALARLVERGEAFAHPGERWAVSQPERDPEPDAGPAET